MLTGNISSPTHPLAYLIYIWFDKEKCYLPTPYQVSAFFKKSSRNSASCQLAAGPYYFCEIWAVRDGFKPICSRVRSAAGPRATRESLSRATGLLAAILAIRGVTWLPRLAGGKQNSPNAVIPGTDGTTYVDVVPHFFLEYMKRKQVTRPRLTNPA